jgi:lipopolysaccharide export system protein LptA
MMPHPFASLCGRRCVAVLTLAIVVLGLVAPPGRCCAQTSIPPRWPSRPSSRGEVNIEADRMEVLEDRKRAIFSGNVDAQRGDIVFKTDRLVADYEGGGSRAAAAPR